MNVVADGTSRRRVLVGAIVIILAALIAYIPAINGGFIWDDDDYLTQNRLVREPGGLAAIWTPGRTRQYYPAVFTTFWLEYRLWGLDATGYHIVNVLLHIANALLVWAVVARLKVRGAWMIGAIFALHPVHVESVAWITERKNVLSACFYLLAALAYLRFDRSIPNAPSGTEAGGEPAADSPGSEGGGRAWPWYLASLLLFILALFSKTVTCSLPAALVLMMLWQQRPLTMRRLLPLAPMFAVGLALALHTAYLERASVGAVGADFDASLIERGLIASRALLFYPWKLLVPQPLMFIYPRWSISASDWLDWLPLLVLLAVAGAAILAFARGRRGPFLALSFYAGTIFPAIGFFNVYPHRFSFVADHFVYLASVGVIALAVGFACRVIPSRRLLCGLATAVLRVLGSLTWVQGAAYRNAETVWRDTIDKNPGAWMAHSNLSAILLRQADAARAGGDPARFALLAAEARAHAEAAIATKPDHSSAHANLAEALRLQGDLEAALAVMRTAIDLVEQRFAGASSRPPALATDYFNLGRLLSRLDRRDEALVAFRDAVDLDPDQPDAHEALARLLAQTDHPGAAIPHYEALLRQRPNDYYAIMSLARILEHEQRFADAAASYRRALGAARLETDRYQAAALVAQFLARCPDPAYRSPEEAVLIAEGLVQRTGRRVPGLLDVLASVYFEVGRREDAIRTGREAVDLARRLGLEDLASEIESRVQGYEGGE